MDPLENCPMKILGYKVKSKLQISLNYLIPTVCECLVFISLMTVDGSLVYQHFIDKNFFYAYLSLGFVILPAILCFLCVIISDQWPNEACCGKLIFFFDQLINTVFFPIGALYRFSRKIFWCIEALFHEKNTYERHQAISKAAQHSPFELYHFLQSFFHCAPQIILQLFVLLRANIFRNYDTAFVQTLSVVFALIKMAMTVESFQRFESQRIVGRCYPWLAPHQLEKKQHIFRRTLSCPVVSVTPREDPVIFKPCIMEENELKTTTEFCKSLNVDENNFDHKDEKVLKEVYFVSNITNEVYPDEVDSEVKRRNVPEDIEEIKEYLRRTNDEVDNEDDDEEDNESTILRNENVHFDRTPSLPPPPQPTSKFPYMYSLHRISTFKDMLIFNAESFIKDKVPRIPDGLFEHHHPIPNEKEIKKEAAAAAATTTRPVTFINDETDILLPTRKKVIQGIENDEMLGKFISFLGWAMFLLMRMISLSVFAVFYPMECAYLCFAHYLFMLICLGYETQLKEKWQRSMFYIVLAYIFIFNLMEFKIKFKNIRSWYIGYFCLVLLQNITMTIVWYGYSTFPENWWFEFMFSIIVQSGISSVLCMLLYFYYLKPKDKAFFVNE
ncbi:unnamed protein product [Diamesa serratosioi]